MTKKVKIVVLAKQVPDTRNVGKDAMKEDGTVNRSALPAIFNPEDMNALEQALRIKDSLKEAEITLLTMGPGRAADIIREGLFRPLSREQERNFMVIHSIFTLLQASL